MSFNNQDDWQSRKEEQ